MITAVANGKLRFSHVRGGVDFTGGGKADALPKAIPDKDAGKRLGTVDVAAAVAESGMLTWEDTGMRGDGVLPNHEMRRHGLLSQATTPAMATETGLSVSRLDAMYLHVEHSVSRGLPGQWAEAGQVLYEVKKRSRSLRTEMQKPFSRAFTAWTTPEQLSTDLIEARRCK